MLNSKMSTLVIDEVSKYPDFNQVYCRIESKQDLHLFFHNE